MKLLLLLLALLSLAACGKDASSSSAPKKIKIEPAQMDWIMGNQFFDCPDNQCPEGVGRLFAINFNDFAKSQTCAAFLITSRHVLTNSHCVHAGKMTLEKTCEGLYFAFPTKWGGYERARCRQVIWRDARLTGRYTDNIKDVAIVELEEASSVPPLKLNFEQPKVGAQLDPLVVDQTGNLTAKVIKLNCKVKENNRRTGVVVLANCPIISGNSGSPVMNAAGEVTALIFASNNLRSRQMGRYSTASSYKGEGITFSMASMEKLLRQYHLP